MKTKIRIQKSELPGYNHLNFQILVQRYNDKTSNYLETACTFTWQQTKGETYWYGFSAEVNSEKEQYFALAAKLLKHVKQNRQTNEPKEVFNILGGEEYILHQSDYIPFSVVGQRFFKVWQHSKNSSVGEESYYTYVIAATEALALKKVEKLKIDFSRLEFKHIITGNAVTY